MTLPTITRGAEPYFHRGGPVGCLCIHGFTASPDEMRWLGTHLAGQGLTIYAPRLVGHGANYRDMSRMRWQDWYLTALDGYHILRQQCEQVFVTGLSMGGLISLLLASSVKVDGVIPMAAPLFTRDPLFEATHWLKYVLPYTKQPDVSGLPERIKSEQERRGMPVVGRVRYQEWSTSAVAELHNIMLATCDCLPHISAPLLAIYSKGDKTVPTTNADLLVSRVGSKIIERVDLEKSDHVVAQEVEADTVFEYVASFINRHDGNIRIPQENEPKPRAKRTVKKQASKNP